MPLKSINPATEEEFATYDELSDEAVAQKITEAHLAFQIWRKVPFAERAKLFIKMSELLKSNSRDYAEIMTREMGKPITQAIAEVHKCALVCEFYAEKAATFLADEIVSTDASLSRVQYDPIGIVLAVMPWNFPFWQVIRAAAPALMAGNVMLLKHASNVPGCAETIEKLFRDTGFPKGVFVNLPVGSDRVAAIISDDRVKAATFTGSEHAGGMVASQCGKEIKKTVLELGGSDPFIVLEDAELEFTCQTAVSARFQNNGQSCIAAKRFIVVEWVYDEFLEKFKTNLEAQFMGDPMDEGTTIGPLATEQILDTISSQVTKSVEMGATALAGGKPSDRKGYFYEPTILSNVRKGMPAYDEETFGPLAVVIKVASEEEAIEIANDTRLGLGASIWTKNTEKALKLSHDINAGAVFINGMVKSDPRLPFGGTNRSGYGRELSLYGIREFVNVKTVWVK